MSTTNYYNSNANNLIKRYDNANMSVLHQLLLKYLSTNSTVLDIGFGSGRDLQYLHDNGYDIWGIDPSKEFVLNAKDRFPTKSKQFFEASVPFDKNIFPIKFDGVIAMWMHLKKEQYEKVVQRVII